MEKEIKVIDSTKQELVLTLTPQDLEPSYREAYKKAQANIDMPGFRKGKVPVSMIKQRFGKELEADAQADLVNEFFGKIVREEKIPVVGHPALTAIDENDNGSITAKVEYEVMPDFDIADFKGLVIDEPVHTVSEEEIEEELQKILVHNGTFEAAEQIENEQFVAGLKFIEIDKETKQPIADIKPYETNVYLADQHVTPEIKRNLLNLKIGDSFEFNPHESEKSSPDKLYKIEVNSIEKLNPMTFTNEWVEEYTKGKFRTTEEFREEIGFKLQENWDKKSRKALEDQLVAKLIDDNNFTAPQGVVSEVVHAMVSDFQKRYKNTPYEKNISYENMKDELWPLAERNLRWEMIRNKIAEKEGITIEEHDLESFIESESQRYQTSKESIRKAIMENQQLIQSLLAQKVIDYVLDFAVTNEVEFSEHHDHNHEHGFNMSPFAQDEDDEEYEDEDEFDEDEFDEEEFDEDEFDDDEFEEEEFDEEEFDETVDPDELSEEEEDDDDENAI